MKVIDPDNSHFSIKGVGRSRWQTGKTKPEYIAVYHGLVAGKNFFGRREPLEGVLWVWTVESHAGRSYKSRAFCGEAVMTSAHVAGCSRLQA